FTHERGRSRLHFHGFGGDAVANVPQVFAERVLQSLVQALYRGAHGADSSAANDALRQLEVVKAKQVDAFVKVEETLRHVMQGKKFRVAAVEVVHGQINLAYLGLEGPPKTRADMQQSEEAGGVEAAA